MQRPLFPRTNRRAPLGGGLLFATLGGGASTSMCADASGYGSHGTLTGMDPATDWVFDSCLGRFVLNCDGSNDYVALPASLSAIQLTDSPGFTLTGWIRPTTIDSNWRTVAIKTNAAGNNRQFFIGLNGGYSCPTNGLTLFTRSDGYGAVGTSALTSGVWYFFAARHFGTVAGGNALYVYSLASGMISANAGSVGSDFTNIDADNGTNPVRISNYLDIANRYWGGDLGDICLWNRRLSDAEIQQLADPSNVMLSGLILPPTRKLWPVAVSAGGSTELVVSGSQCVVNSPEVALVQHHALTGSSSQCVVQSPTVALIQHHALTGTSSDVVVTSPTVTLIQHHAVAVSASQCLITSAEPALVQHHALTIPASQCVVNSPTVTLSVSGSLAVESSECLVTSTDIALTQHHVLTVDSAQCLVMSPSISWTTTTYRPMQFQVC